MYWTPPQRAPPLLSCWLFKNCKNRHNERSHFPLYSNPLSLLKVLNIAASLLAFTAFIEMLNNLTMWFAGNKHDLQKYLVASQPVNHKVNCLFLLAWMFHSTFWKFFPCAGHAGEPELTLTTIMGYIFYPLALCMGIKAKVSKIIYVYIYTSIYLNTAWE